jgi:hypothetical protein
VKVDDLEPRRHEPPAGWSREVFEAVTDALAAALLAALERERSATNGVASDEP